MAAGWNPYNIDFTLVLFNVWFAFVILFRESFDSPHPQGSWSLNWMALRISIAMVPWLRGPRSFSTPTANDLPSLLFVYSPCHAFNCFLLLVWHVTWFGLYSILNMFPFSSDCHFVLWTISFLPFLKHSPRVKTQCLSRKKPHGSIIFGVQVMLAPCTTYSHNLWTLWPLWIFWQYRFWVGHFVTPRRGRLHGGATLSWSYFHTQNMSFLFNIQSLHARESHDFPRLAHKRKTYYCK